MGGGQKPQQQICFKGGNDDDKNEDCFVRPDPHKHCWGWGHKTADSTSATCEDACPRLASPCGGSHCQDRAGAQPCGVSWLRGCWVGRRQQHADAPPAGCCGGQAACLPVLYLALQRAGHNQHDGLAGKRGEERTCVAMHGGPGRLQAPEARRRMCLRAAPIRGVRARERGSAAASAGRLGGRRGVGWREARRAPCLT